VRFLADMGLSQSTVAFLRAEGHEAVHLRDQGLQRLADVHIVQKSILEDRVILTHDLDFSRIVAQSHSSKPSVSTFRLSDMRPSHVNHYLTQPLARSSRELEAGALISVNERGIRVRTLPIGVADR